VPTMLVSANYFQTIDVALARGPGFDTVMAEPLKAEPVVILGYRFWQNQLGSDPDIVGKTLTLDDIPHVVVGIAPELFEGHLFLHRRELFVPLERHPVLRDKNIENKVRSDRSNQWIYINGRLSPGVGLAQASAAVSAATSRLAKQRWRPVWWGR
jgi:putative ABC transport system permease protein